ncbi:hypothetical protein LEL_03580 [Akanthomyces lecanii RCEF 1005]|uniref:Uncharacterized protein n=1 Tax=Akanthomyces lecanii RCEF 1005 TaxID=1081108 RepID=A0A168J7E9_CORDF|nr:hypothetical protein LEL_03580 [Akanthomyces lecanii RCEF 1005]
MDVDKWLGSVNLYEAAQIWARFNSACEPHKTVLWSGIEFEQAEDWARKHDRKTLTQAMGPLMDKSDPSCRRNIKDHDQWCLYVHAASILFAVFISTGSEVVVLARHPPQRFNPYYESYYQNIEEPWFTACCDPDKFKIMLAHPQIESAGDCLYQYWPVDRVDEWKRMFPHPKVLRPRPWPHHTWDSVKTSECQETDLRREKHTIMEKLYFYKTGASIYWAVTTSRATATLCAEKCRRKLDNQRLPVEANPLRVNASNPPQQAKSKICIYGAGEIGVQGAGKISIRGAGKVYIRSEAKIGIQGEGAAYIQDRGQDYIQAKGKIYTHGTGTAYVQGTRKVPIRDASKADF